MEEKFRERVTAIIGERGLQDLEEAGFLIVRRLAVGQRICAACGYEIEPGQIHIRRHDGTFEHDWGMCPKEDG